MKQIINTPKAPAAIGTYSQAVKSGVLVFLSGQIPLDPGTMEVVKGDFKDRVRRVFENIKAVVEEAGGSLPQIVKLTIYLTTMDNFSMVNEVMKEYFFDPYPARAVVAVAALPKNVDIEIDSIMILNE
jgi:reactive intermediate/imine deaminase